MNGTLKWVFEKGQFFTDENGAVRLEGIVLNIQERKRAELINQALYNISNAVNTTLDLDDLYRSIHTSMNKMIDARNFKIALIDESRDRIIFPYQIAEIPGPDAAPIEHASRSSLLTCQVIKNGCFLLLGESEINGLATGKNSLMSSAHAHYKTWLGVPLKGKERVLGAIILISHDTPNCFSQRDVTLLNAVSDQIAFAIERKQSEGAAFRPWAYHENGRAWLWSAQ